MKTNGSRGLSDEQLRLMERLARDGVNAENIARRVGCTRGNVHKRCKKHGWPLNITPRQLMVQTNWTPPLVERLERLWRDGHTASEIARSLGNGLSRSAVLGKINRLGLTGIARREKARQSPHSRPRALPPTPLPKPKPETGAKMLTLLELTDDTCKWPVKGTGENCRFCGHASEKGSSYCLRHMLDSFNPETRKAYMQQRAA